MNNIKTIVKCAQCQRFKTGKVWKHTRNIPGSTVIYSHGLCPDCLDNVMIALDQDERLIKLRIAS